MLVVFSAELRFIWTSLGENAGQLLQSAAHLSQNLANVKLWLLEVNKPKALFFRISKSMTSKK